MNIKTVETEQEKQQAFQVRTKVFVEEQKVPTEEEIDQYDETATHLIGYDQQGEPIAASRLRFIDEFGKLERICVRKEERGKSYGADMIAAMEKIIVDHGYRKAKLNAQIQAKGFYQRLGYQTISGEFMDAGIPHVTMVKDL
ncbi:GNAT family N-acetyltransferase [Virgibacillus xinjiangensis]|uniref:GNAT family N-acetyltransferase n=1 Tax=Virgibacillus xinjiangensis TaxID=393090 RepID=A0ABV7CWD7_9BACI